MVCSNCHSTDIAQIQGQYYCLNCGRPVATSKTMPEAKVKSSTPSVSAPIVNHAKTVKVELKTPDRTPRLEKVVKLEPSVPSAPDPKEHRVEPSHKTAAKARNHHQGPLWGYLLAYGVMSALPVSLALTHPSVGFELVIPAALYLTSLYLIRLYVGNLVIFGSAKHADHRPVSGNDISYAAWYKLGASIRLDLLFVGALGTIILFLGLMVQSVQWLPDSWQPAKALILALFSAVSLWSLLQLIIARLSAHLAVVLGNQPPDQALSIGWRLLRHHAAHISESAGFLTIVNATIAVTYVLCLQLLLRAWPSITPVLPLVVFASAAPLMAWVYGFNLHFWREIYTNAVKMLWPGRIGALLAAPTTHKSALGRYLVAASTIGFLVSAVITFRT